MIKGHNSMVKAQPNEYNIYKLKPESELGEESLLQQHYLPNLSCIILYILDQHLKHTQQAIQVISVTIGKFNMQYTTSLIVECIIDKA